MHKLSSFIKQANQVLFFLGAVLFIVLISKELISDLFPNRYEPPKIEIVDSSKDEESAKKQVYTVEYIAQLKDVHIFELASNVIDISNKHEAKVYQMSARKAAYDLSYRNYLSDNAVNLMFVKEDGTKRMLIEKDGLITKFSKVNPPNNEHGHTLDKNVYLIIDKDTNENGFLDRKDKANLFTSEYDGKNLTLVLSDVGSFNLIDDNKMIVTQSGKVANFYTFDVKDSSLVKLNTAID